MPFAVFPPPATLTVRPPKFLDVHRPIAREKVGTDKAIFEGQPYKKACFTSIFRLRRGVRKSSFKDVADRLRVPLSRRDASRHTTI